MGGKKKEQPQGEAPQKSNRTEGGKTNGTDAVTAADLVQEQSGDIKKLYKIERVLGSGSFGEVRKVVDKRTGIVRAMKKLRKDSCSPSESSKLIEEINILRKLDHPNIIRVYEFFQDSTYFYIVTEFCSGGELFDRIIDLSHFSEAMAANTMKQLLSAVVYCHQHNIVHRDLKPENLLLETKDPDSQIKVIDFGTSSVFKKDHKMKKRFGTPYYIAPEVLNRSYDEKCDVWSAGVILYILLSGSPPFNGRDDSEILKAVSKGAYNFDDPIWKTVSSEAKDLINKMLTFDPKHRVTAEEALNHSWIQNMANKQDIADQSAAKNTLGKLREFTASQKLQQATIAFISSHLSSKEEKEEMKNLFQAIDEDQNGVLTRDELVKGYKRLYGEIVSEEEIEETFSKIDTDGSGQIDYSEFIAACMYQSEFINSQRLRVAFKVLDTDNSGSINAQELKKALGGNRFDDNFWEGLISEVDLNGDGEISFQEFQAMMSKTLSTN